MFVFKNKQKKLAKYLGLWVGQAPLNVISFSLASRPKIDQACGKIDILGPKGIEKLSISMPNNSTLTRPLFPSRYMFLGSVT